MLNEQGGMAQWQRVRLQIRRLGVRISLASYDQGSYLRINSCARAAPAAGHCRRAGPWPAFAVEMGTATLVGRDP